MKSMQKIRVAARNSIDASRHSLTLCDLRLPDAPLVYVNRGFELLSGYAREEVLGRNCRFLQGPGTDPSTVEKIRAAVNETTSLLVDILNYRKDGSAFWNRLSLRPAFGPGGSATHIIGIQSDMTDVRASEEILLSYAQQLPATQGGLDGPSVHRSSQGGRHFPSDRGGGVVKL